MVSFEMNDHKKIGLGLKGFGIFFSFLGVIFFFDKGLLAMGNTLFVSGVSLTIGLKSTMQFFTKRSNFKIKERKERNQGAKSEETRSHVSKATTSRQSRWNHTDIFLDFDEESIAGVVIQNT